MEQLSFEEKMMRLALDEAQKAFEMGEVPIGAVVVRGNQVIATAHNLRETEKNALCHAELLAIDRACKKLGGWRLHECDLYVTLEPCPMCAGAIINSRIKRVIFGAHDAKAGACGSCINLFACDFNHHPILYPGVLEKECAEILQAFFKKLRNKS